MRTSTCRKEPCHGCGSGKWKWRTNRDVPAPNTCSECESKSPSRTHLNALSDHTSRITVGELPGYGIAIYDKGDGLGGHERVLIANHIEAERIARALADRFGSGRFKVIRQRNSEGRFEP